MKYFILSTYYIYFTNYVYSFKHKRLNQKYFKMNKKKIFVLILMVVCRTIDSNYIKAKPNFKTIKLINELYKKNKIIIFTSRYMGRNKDNVIKAKMQGYNRTFKQLKKMGSKFS